MNPTRWNLEFDVVGATSSNTAGDPELTAALGCLTVLEHTVKHDIAARIRVVSYLLARVQSEQNHGKMDSEPITNTATI